MNSIYEKILKSLGTFKRTQAFLVRNQSKVKFSGSFVRNYYIYKILQKKPEFFGKWDLTICGTDINALENALTIFINELQTVEDFQLDYDEPNIKFENDSLEKVQAAISQTFNIIRNRAYYKLIEYDSKGFATKAYSSEKPLRVTIKTQDKNSRTSISIPITVVYLESDRTNIDLFQLYYDQISFFELALTSDLNTFDSTYMKNAIMRFWLDSGLFFALDDIVKNTQGYEWFVEKMWLKRIEDYARGRSFPLHITKTIYRSIQELNTFVDTALHSPELLYLSPVFIQKTYAVAQNTINLDKTFNLNSIYIYARNLVRYFQNNHEFLQKLWETYINHKRNTNQGITKTLGNTLSEVVRDELPEFATRLDLQNSLTLSTWSSYVTATFNNPVIVYNIYYFVIGIIFGLMEQEIIRSEFECTLFDTVEETRDVLAHYQYKLVLRLLRLDTVFEDILFRAYARLLTSRHLQALFKKYQQFFDKTKREIMLSQTCTIPLFAGEIELNSDRYLRYFQWVEELVLKKNDICEHANVFGNFQKFIHEIQKKQ